MHRTVVVAHRKAMVAEGISAALSRYPGLVAIGSATSAPAAERLGARADAVAIDVQMPSSDRVARRLRRRGVRVVFLGRRGGEEGVDVPTEAPIAVLADALFPGVRSSSPAARLLTARERDVLRLVTHGLAGKQVAKALGISPKTVEQHKTRIYAKLGVSNQTAAVAVALRDGPKSGDA